MLLRRDIVAATAAMGATLVAGCSGLTDGDDDDQQGDDSDPQEDGDDDGQQGDDSEQPSEPQGPSGSVDFSLVLAVVESPENGVIREFDELVVNFESLTFHEEDGSDETITVGTQYDLASMTVNTKDDDATDGVEVATDIEMPAGAYDSATLEMPVESATIDGAAPDGDLRRFEDKEVDVGISGPLELAEDSSHEFTLKVSVVEAVGDYFLETRGTSV